ncbi:hypothetical protein SY212_02820 [Ligilactobacillus agilis]|uniref:Uncharacterized protein n=1 Tax=Ligilactobacillus agilis TaxID=1601 RepID=A0A6F9XJ19_9LACO|nr:hypothetical protein [Ligilactobacillus agilis]GET05252.1 hypothetical protein SY212_02820 [Ligilactobacillus agilis]
MRNENKTITIKISKSRNCDIMYGWDVVQDESEGSLESLYALFALLRHCEIETDATMESYLESLSKLVKAFRVITNAEKTMLQEVSEDENDIPFDVKTLDRFNEETQTEIIKELAIEKGLIPDDSTNVNNVEKYFKDMEQ